MRTSPSGAVDFGSWTLPEMLANGDNAVYEPTLEEEEPAAEELRGALRSPFAFSLAPQEEEPGFSVEGELEDWADLLQRLPDQVRLAIRNGLVPLAVQLLVVGGARDETWLTNVLFHVRHPELHGRDIKRGETKLADEWKLLRDKYVRPALAAARSAPAAGPVAPSVPAAPASPTRSPSAWQARALAVAGIDAKAWDPAAGFGKLRPIAEKVYGFYTTCFNGNQNLRWAGMAKLAGGELYHAWLLAQAFIDVPKWSSFDPVGGPDVVGPIFAAYSAELSKILLEAQKAIFVDLAWQHQAFLEGGLAEMEAQNAAEVDVTITAWRDLASGQEDRVRRAGKELLRHEQEVVVASHYRRIQDIPDANMIPWGMSWMARSPIPGGKDFTAVVPGGDLTVFKDRWRWIELDMLPAYDRLTPRCRHQLVNTPLADLAQHNWPRC